MRRDLPIIQVIATMQILSFILELTEICDGVFNDCNDPSINIQQAPDDDDADGDLYVECTYDANTWVGDFSILGG